MGQASILKCVSLCASTSTPTLAGSSRYSSIWVCLRNTLPRHALHNTRWKTGREGGREKILKEANFPSETRSVGSSHESGVRGGGVFFS